MQTIVPDELKSISPFIARSNELVIAEPVIAYWCLYYALNKSMSIGKSAESNAFLLNIMDKLEIMKGELEANSAVTDDAAAAEYVQGFAFKVFGQADKEDRAGRATRLTAKKFLASANFLELLSTFGDATSEIKEKITYSKWKASDIGRAFREGRKPVPGPAGGLPNEDDDIERTTLSAEEEKELTRELAGLGTGEERAKAMELGGETPAQSTRASSSVHDDLGLPATPSFAPSSLNPTIDDERPVTPAFPSFLNTPSNSSFIGLEQDSDSAFPSPLITPIVPPSHQTRNLPPPVVDIASAFPAAVFPSAPSLPLVQTQSYFPPQPTTPIASARIIPAIASSTESMDPLKIELIQKHAKWAISALNYEDLDTARKELRAALIMLGD